MHHSTDETDLDIQIFSRPEVHDMNVEIIVCSLGQQLAQNKDLRSYVQDRLSASAAYLHLCLAALNSTKARTIAL